MERFRLSVSDVFVYAAYSTSPSHLGKQWHDENIFVISFFCRHHTRAKSTVISWIDLSADEENCRLRANCTSTAICLTQWRRQDFCNRRGEVRYGSIGGLKYEVPQSRLYCLCINVALCSTALQCICRVIRRSSIPWQWKHTHTHTHTHLTALLKSTKRAEQATSIESTHILHNFWTSTHRGEAPPGGATDVTQLLQVTIFNGPNVERLTVEQLISLIPSSDNQPLPNIWRYSAALFEICLRC